MKQINMELFLSDDRSSTKNYFLNDIVEKPQTNPPSNLAVLEDMFFLNILNILENLDPSVGGEVQLTDAIKLMLDDEKVSGYLYEGSNLIADLSMDM